MSSWLHHSDAPESSQGAQTMPGYSIGIDIGGTFTDCFVTDGTSVWTAKASTTPRALHEGLIESLRLAAGEIGIGLPELCRSVVHFGLGTTAVTNVLAEMRGARTGLVTTRGFGDLFTIARGHRIGRDGMSDFLPEIVPRERVAEVPERIDSAGTVLLSLDVAGARREIARLVDEEHIEALAVCLLWSCRNPAHEIEIRRLVSERWPDLFVSLSCEVFPVIREYERMTTTVLNAYSWRSFSTFLDQMEKGLRENGLGAPVAIMQSSGGTFSAEEARALPVYLAQSGPVAGVMAAQRIGLASGRRNLITADLGGTSYDVCLVHEGEPVTKVRAELFGLWTGLVMVDVTSIGAGGGSVGWIDSRGMLQVGPRSAGADPGPSCYGRGGGEPTLTDALVVLGFLDPELFLGGRMKLDPEAARGAMRPLAETMGVGEEEAAAGIYRMALENMTLATKGLITEKGYDPRDFSLVSYGGGGSLFTALVARDLGIRDVVVPSLASVFSAHGAATADTRRDATRTVFAEMPADPAALEAVYRELAAEVRARIGREAEGRLRIEVVWEADLRFSKQSWEVTVSLPEEPITRDTIAALERAFLEKYERLYGKGVVLRESGIQLVNCRAVGHGRRPKPPIPRLALGPPDPSTARRTTRRIRVPTVGMTLVPREVAIYSGRRLRPGMRVAGPALIEYPDTTVFVPDGMTGSIDEIGSVVISRPQP
jgi:N-methylhydantoinase A